VAETKAYIETVVKPQSESSTEGGGDSEGQGQEQLQVKEGDDEAAAVSCLRVRGVFDPDAEVIVRAKTSTGFDLNQAKRYVRIVCMCAHIQYN
jgi:ABC-type microcin C transport system permease subunit YejB